MKYIFSVILICILLCGCSKAESVENTSKENKDTVTSKVKVDSVIYASYEDMLSVYKVEPYYTENDWVNENNKLLYPYMNNADRMKGIENIVASLYMPENVVSSASTDELFKVVTSGLLETYATSPSLYNHPSQYVSYCSSINQAMNEVLQRSDMAEVIYEDYCKRNYEEGDVSFENSKLQLEEIILGSNYAFNLMDDEMRDKVIKEVLKKDAKNSTSLTSGFFAIIEEEHMLSESLWYTYICDKQIDEAKDKIDIDNPSWRE